MANEFYNRGAAFNPDELADGDAIEAEFDAVARGFDTICTNVDANKAGYQTQTFHVAPATETTHAVPKAQMDTALGLKLDAVNYNASDILTKLKTVDGTGSGLDADLLDGQDSTYYRNASNINAGTLAKERLPASIDASTTGNAATATNATYHIADTGYNAHGAQSANVPNAIMVRDANGDVSARTFVGNLRGSGLSQVGSLMVGGYNLTEYGKNDSGEYWRFADGEQICFRSVGANLQSPTIHNFAGYFASGITPVVLVTNDNGSPAYSSSLNITNEKFEFVSSVSSNTVKVIAIGRWY